MTWKRVTSYIPSCDGCGFDCWGDTETAPEYTTPLIGRMDLVERHEWRVERTTAGIVMWCSDCAAKADCEKLGHHWQPPVVDEQDPLSALLPDHCERCAIIRRTDRPEGDHPESVALELDDQAEEWLALVDAELFPEEAA